MTSVNLIPRKRLKLIPRDLRLSHEYCFFLHDQCVRILIEYEAAKAHEININFNNKNLLNRFKILADKNDVIFALREIGYLDEAKRITINNIIMAMVSDFLHHICEALFCLEKRKIVVAFNLLRKPLTDSLLYLCWILCEEDDFYSKFISKSPSGISSALVKSRKIEIIEKAILITGLNELISAEYINEKLFLQKGDVGFQKFFQHAVHLVTVQKEELRTSEENFNFIFKNLADNDLYDYVYKDLPNIMYFVSRVIFELFQKILPSDEGAVSSLNIRSMICFNLLNGYGDVDVKKLLEKYIRKIRCKKCKSSIILTSHNVARLCLMDNFRCTECKTINAFPFSWII